MRGDDSDKNGGEKHNPNRQGLGKPYDRQRLRKYAN